MIHDGRELYPGAVDCLTRLRDSGRRIVFLTNAPRRAARVIEQLDRFGVDRGLYDGVVSSGKPRAMPRPACWPRARSADGCCIWGRRAMRGCSTGSISPTRPMPMVRIWCSTPASTTRIQGWSR
ncbi:hypothetical protein ACFQ4K_14590 [Tistrella bauzanensis]